MNTKRNWIALCSATLMIASLVIGGCSNLERARTAAELLAAHTERIRVETESFAEHQTHLAQARQRASNRLEEATQRWEASARRSQEVWRITGEKQKLSLFRTITEVADNDAKSFAQAAEMQARRAEEVKALRSGVTVRSKKLTETAKALGQLGKKPSISEELRFFVSFASKVRDSIKEAEEAGQAAADSGGQMVEESTQEAEAAEHSEAASLPVVDSH